MSELTIRQCEEKRKILVKELLHQLNVFEEDTGLMVSKITIGRPSLRTISNSRRYSQIDLLEVEVELP